MDFFWVNLGRSYKFVKAERFLWAPKHSLRKNGKWLPSAGWVAVPNVKAGDVIFCNVNGNLIYVAVAKSDAFASKRPTSPVFREWDDDGFRVDVEVTTLNPPISINQFRQTLIDIHNEQCKPVLFTKGGDLAQQYLVALPQGAGAVIMGALGEAEFEVEKNTTVNSGKKKLSAGGVRETVAQARIGQGQFRDDVLALWNYACPVTGVSKIEVLTASHVVPWSLSSDTEKIDPYNGFPFSPSVDKLFDRGYISFDSQGKLLVSSSIATSELTRLGIPLQAVIAPLNANQQAYLARHRVLNHFSD